MGITEQAEKHLKGKSVIIVTNSLDRDGYVQEIAGTLLEAIDDGFILGQLNVQIGKCDGAQALR